MPLPKQTKRNHKPNPRAVLKTMDDGWQEELRSYARTHSLEECVAYCLDTWGIKTNDTSVSEWVLWFDMEQRLDDYHEDAEKFMAKIKRKGLDEDLVVLLGQAYFLNQAARAGDVKGYSMVAGVMQRHFELRDRRSAHADKMALGQAQLKTRRKGVAIAARKLRAAEKRIKALEEKNELMRKAATKAKEILGKGGSMSAAQRAAFITETDRILGLNKRAPTASKA